MIRALSAEDAPPEKKALAVAFEKAKRGPEATGDFIRQSGRYPLTAVGDINTYAVFAETFLRTINEDGRTGYIVPPGILSDDTLKDFFQ